MSHHAPNQPFAIPQIRGFVPEWLRPWVMILMIVIFNCTGGVYLASASEMVGTTQLLQEDVMMAGYASLVGMALFFAIMFRLKWAVRPRTTLLACIPVMIAANVISLYTTSVPLLVGVSLVAGFFRMWAIYECNSTIQLWITPKRDMSVWFCYIYLMVNGSIQLTGIGALSLSVWASWHFMHYFIIGLLSLVWLFVLVAYKDIRVMPHMPLLGIDWMGMVLWGASAMSVLFICIYGEHYDWWQSSHIRFATLFGVVTLAMNLWRASFIRHPYISLNIFSFSVVPISVAVLLLMDLLLAPSHIFEHALMEGVLHYDQLHILSLNFVAIAGVVAGILFTWLTFARRKWTYQRMFVIAFSCFALYLVYFYLRLDYNLDKWMLFFPIFIRSAGYVIVAVLLLTANTRLPFPFVFLHGLSFQNLFSAALAGPIGTAIVGRMLTVTTERNSQWLSEGIDALNPAAQAMPYEALYGTVRLQALVEGMKEIYGWLFFVAIGCLIVLMLRYSGVTPRRVIEPTYRALFNLMREERKGLWRLFQRNKASYHQH